MHNSDPYQLLCLRELKQIRTSVISTGISTGISTFLSYFILFFVFLFVFCFVLFCFTFFCLFVCREGFMCSFGDSEDQAGLQLTDSSCLFLLSASSANSNIYIGLSILQLWDIYSNLLLNSF